MPPPFYGKHYWMAAHNMDNYLKPAFAWKKGRSTTPQWVKDRDAAWVKKMAARIDKKFKKTAASQSPVCF